MLDEGGDLFVFHAKTRSYIIPRLTEALKNRPIKSSDVSALIAIHDHPGCTIKDICLDIAGDKGLMTNKVHHLIEIGMVENRSPGQKNYKLYLTESGNVEYEYAHNALKTINDSLTINFTERQKETFIKLMKKIEEITDLGYRYRCRDRSRHHDQFLFETVRMNVLGN